MKINNRWLFLLFAFFPTFCFAEDQSLGDISGNLFTDVLALHSIAKAIGIVAGVALLLGSVIKFRKYRQNPIEVTLGNVIITAIFGVILLVFAIFVTLQQTP